MLARLYKSATFVQNLVIVLAGAALWFPRFYTPQTMTTDYQQPLFDLCFGGLSQFPYISTGIALLLLLVAAFVEQQSLHFDRLRISGHSFPALLFVALSATPHVALFSPVIFTAAMLAVALLLIFRIPETLQNDHLIFFTAFFFGIATLFYLPALFLMALFIAFFFGGGYFSSKKTVVALLGFLLPVIWAAAGLYLSSNLLPLIEQWKEHFFLFSYPQPDSDIASLVVLSLLVLVYISMISRILSKLPERTAIIRRRITISVYLAFLIFVGAFFSYNFYEHLSLLSVPMVALISYYYNEDAETSWGDYTLLGCFVALVIYSFLQL
ncbi:MAG: hypothetical protein FWG84_06725 [Bacteroidales bacterium]|nr:hypothetical protein [Bacteroidales bacterium]